MESFEQIWESSRHNAYSWAYPAAFWSGTAVLVALSVISNRIARRSAKVLAILVFSGLALQASSAEIVEKWRIRGEWADANEDLMTQSDWDALMSDGANLVLGPVIFSVGAFLWLSGVALALLIVRLIVNHLRKRPESEAVSKEDPPIETGNPYQPPKTESA